MSSTKATSKAREPSPVLVSRPPAVPHSIHLPTVPGIQGSYVTNSHRQAGHTVFVKATDIIANDQARSPLKKKRKGKYCGFGLGKETNNIELGRLPDSSLDLKETTIAKYHFGYKKHHPIASSGRYLVYGVHENRIRIIDQETNENKLFHAPSKVEHISISDTDVPLISILLSNSTIIVGTISTENESTYPGEIGISERYIINHSSGGTFLKTYWHPQIAGILFTTGSDGSLLAWDLRDTHGDRLVQELDENSQNYTILKLIENGAVINSVEFNKSGDFLLATSLPNKIMLWKLSASGMERLPIQDFKTPIAAAFFIDSVEPNEKSLESPSLPPILIASDPLDSMSLWLPVSGNTLIELEHLQTISLNPTSLPGKTWVYSCLNGASVILTSHSASRIYVIRFTRRKLEREADTLHQSTRFYSISGFDLNSDIFSMSATAQYKDYTDVATKESITNLDEPYVAITTVFEYELKQFKLKLSSIKVKDETVPTVPVFSPRNTLPHDNKGENLKPEPEVKPDVEYSGKLELTETPVIPSSDGSNTEKESLELVEPVTNDQKSDADEKKTIQVESESKDEQKVQEAAESGDGESIENEKAKKKKAKKKKKKAEKEDTNEEKEQQDSVAPKIQPKTAVLPPGNFGTSEIISAGQTSAYVVDQKEETESPFAYDSFTQLLGHSLSQLSADIEEKIERSKAATMVSMEKGSGVLKKTIESTSTTISEAVKKEIKLQVKEAVQSALPTLANMISNKLKDSFAQLHAAEEASLREGRKIGEATLNQLSNMAALSEKHYAESAIQQSHMAMNMDRALQNSMNHYFGAYNQNLTSLSRDLNRLSGTVTSLESKLDRLSSQTESNVSQSDPLLLHHIARDFENGKYLSCFEDVLSLSSLPLLMSLCKRLSADDAIPQIKSNQLVLLSLIQQLSFDWEADQAVKLDWIRESLLSIELDDPAVMKTGRIILTFVQTQVLRLGPDVMSHSADAVRQIVALTGRYNKILKQ